MLFSFLSPTLSRVLMAPASEGGDGSGSEETTKTQTPETQTGGTDDKKGDEKAGDKEIDPLTLDIKKAVEKARQQEKSKLYGEMETLKKSLAEREKALKEKDEALKKLADGIVKPETKKEDDDKKAEKKGVPGMTAEQLDKIIEAAVTTTSKSFQEQLEAANRRVQEMEQRLSQADLAAYKDQLISENKDSIIPELVSGSTREELEHSLILAKQVFARVAPRRTTTESARTDEDASAKASKKVITVPTPSVNTKDAPGTVQQVDVSQLSMKDYAAHREQLLKAAAAEARKALAQQDA